MRDAYNQIEEGNFTKVIESTNVLCDSRWLSRLQYTHIKKATKWNKISLRGRYHLHVYACLWNFLQSKVSCCLHMYFLWRHHLPRDQSENDQDSDSDWLIDWLIDLRIVLTYDCWHCFLVFNIWVSHALEMTINFYYPTLESFCFSFTQPCTHSKFGLPNPFLFGASPHHKYWPLHYFLTLTTTIWCTISACMCLVNPTYKFVSLHEKVGKVKVLGMLATARVSQQPPALYQHAT